MKLSNLEMTEKSIDVQENDMLLGEVRRQVNPLSFCTCTHFVKRIHITPHRTSAEERVVGIKYIPFWVELRSDEAQYGIYFLPTPSIYISYSMVLHIIRADILRVA